MMKYWKLLIVEMMKCWKLLIVEMMKWWNKFVEQPLSNDEMMKWWNNEICWMMKWWNSEMLTRTVARHEFQNRPPIGGRMCFSELKYSFVCLNYTRVVSKMSIHNTWAYKTCPHTPSSQKPRGFVNENNWMRVRTRWNSYQKHMQNGIRGISFIVLNV